MRRNVAGHLPQKEPIVSEVNFVELLAKLGIKAEAADPTEEGVLEVALTIGQYAKLLEVLPTTSLMTIRGNRVVAGVDPVALATAVENHVKAPRASAGNVNVAVRTVYTVDAPEAVNKVTSGWWEIDGGA